MPGAKAGVRRETFHVTREGNVEPIKRQGFHGTPGDNGELFGRGTYVHTDKEHSDRYLQGQQMFVWGDEVQVRTQTKVKNPLVIHATRTEHNPARLMGDALRKGGYIKPGEYNLTPDQITARLKKAGFDGIEVRQEGYNDDVAGSQIAVFDPKNVRIRPDLKPERALVLKKERKGTTPSGASTGPYQNGKISGMTSSAAGKPDFPAHRGTLGAKVATSVEGLQAYKVEGGLYDVAVFKDDKVVGYVKKRSGSSTRAIGPGRTQTANKTGYAYYGPDGKQHGTATTRTSAFSSIKLRTDSR